MPSFQRVEVIGHVGQDPEVRQSASGMDIANFSVAASEKYKDKEHTEWFRVTVFGNSVAAYIQPYVRKGGLVRVEGKLRTRQWEDKEGNTRYSTDLIAASFSGVMVLGGKGGGSQKREAPAASQDFDDDMPFDKLGRGLSSYAF